MHVQNTAVSNRRPDRDHLETALRLLVVRLARAESFIRQRSMLRSLADNRPLLARRRRRVEIVTAEYIAELVNLGHDHGVDPLRDIHGVDLRLVRLATAPLERRTIRPAGDITLADSLVVFTNEKLVDRLYELANALRTWEWYAATESCEEASPEEIGELVLERLQAAATAAGRKEGGE